MPVAPTYPGVYIQEIPSGVRTIVGVATSTTAFVGRAPRGPADEPILVSSFADFERTFGALDAAYPLGYTVFDFFQNGGSQAIIVRVFKDAAIDAAIAVAAAAQASTDADPLKVAAAAKAVSDTFTNDPAKTAAGAVQAKIDAAAAGAGATPDAVKKAGNDQAAATEPSGAATFELKPGIKLAAASPGTWGQNLAIKVDIDGIDDKLAKAFGLSDKKYLFNLTVVESPPGPASEKFYNVSLHQDAGARRLDRVLKSESVLIRLDPKYIPSDAAKAEAPAPTAAGKDPTSMSTKPEDIAGFTGGGDSLPLTTKDDFLGSSSAKTGLNALEKADLFNLLCIPPDSRLPGRTDLPSGLHADALAYCVRRRALFIVDPPSSWSNRQALLSDARSQFDGLGLAGPDARNAALYYPRVQKTDPKRQGQVDTFVACGMVAGIMARTDTARGVWKAPAGLDATLSGTSGLEVNLTDLENGTLNQLGINCLRAFPGSGRVVWGARTMRGSDQFGDEYKYVPIRRLALYIEESLFRGTQWVVFEPNDEPLWAQIRLNVGAFMHDLFRQGAFQGSTPQAAYFVRCDGTTTTQNDRDRGIVNIVVGFAPLKPAEFVIISLQQIAGQIQV